MRHSVVRKMLVAMSAVCLVALTAWTADPVAPAAAPAVGVRHIWAFSDSHIGLAKDNDNKDGADWFKAAIDDLKQKMGGADYVFGLGDLTNVGSAEEMKAYGEIREKSGIKNWFEINGNHDWAGTTQPAWGKTFPLPSHYVVEDGNCAFIFFGSEQGAADGRISKETLAWLKTTIDKYKDRNVIVCSHQAVFNTVAGSTRDKNALYVGGPRYGRSDEEMAPEIKAGHEAVAKALESVRVDLWLNGHIHSNKRTAAYVAKTDKTTFINVSSTGHNYNTGASNSYLLEMTEGAKTLLARCRNHDTQSYVDDQEVKVELPFAVKLSPKGPRVITDASAEKAGN